MERALRRPEGQKQRCGGRGQPAETRSSSPDHVRLPGGPSNSAPWRTTGHRGPAAGAVIPHPASGQPGRSRSARTERSRTGSAGGSGRLRLLRHAGHRTATGAPLWTAATRPPPATAARLGPGGEPNGQGLVTGTATARRRASRSRHGRHAAATGASGWGARQPATRRVSACRPRRAGLLEGLAPATAAPAALPWLPPKRRDDEAHRRTGRLAIIPSPASLPHPLSPQRALASAASRASSSASVPGGTQHGLPRHGNNQQNYGEAVAASPDGAIGFVTGITGVAHVSTVAYDAATGVSRWTATFDGRGDSQPSGIAVSPDSSKVFVTGYTSFPTRVAPISSSRWPTTPSAEPASGWRGPSTSSTSAAWPPGSR